MLQSEHNLFRTIYFGQSISDNLCWWRRRNSNLDVLFVQTSKVSGSSRSVKMILRSLLVDVDWSVHCIENEFEQSLLKWEKYKILRENRETNICQRTLQKNKFETNKGQRLGIRYSILTMFRLTYSTGVIGETIIVEKSAPETFRIYDPQLRIKEKFMTPHRMLKLALFIASSKFTMFLCCQALLF